MVPGRLGARFALEALFIVLLAVGAGLADLRPAFIVLVMALAWLLVALIELTAERIARSPVSYLLPNVEPDAGEEAPAPERVFAPPVEERTVVAPPAALEDTQEPRPEPEGEPEPAPEREPQPLAAEARAGPEPEPEADAEAESLELPPLRRLGLLLRRPAASEPEPQPLPEPKPEVLPQPEEVEPAPPGRLRALFRRREPEPEPILEPPPRHVKLLPRRPAPEAAPVPTEVAELFEGEQSADAEETAG